MAPDPSSGAKHTLPRTARLLASGDFERVQKQGRSVDLGAWVFRVAPFPVAKAADGRYASATHGRLGLAVSRKVGNAVERNRAKRLARDCFRRHKDAFAGLDVVAIGRPAAATLGQADVDRLFEQLLRRLRS